MQRINRNIKELPAFFDQSPTGFLFEYRQSLLWIAELENALGGSAELFLCSNCSLFPACLDNKIQSESRSNNVLFVVDLLFFSSGASMAKGDACIKCPFILFSPVASNYYDYHHLSHLCFQAKRKVQPIILFGESIFHSTIDGRADTANL